MASKINLKQFSFQVRPWRINRDGWKIYYDVKRMKNKTEFEKAWLKRVRAQFRHTKMEVEVIHLPTGYKRSMAVNGTINRKQLAKDTILALQGQRKLRRMPKTDRPKNFAGVTYKTYGGSFLEGGQILEIAKMPYWNDPTKPKVPRSKNRTYIGVELEFLDHGRHQQRDIVEAFRKAELGKFVCVGRDGSCGWEVRVLLPEDDWIKPLENILNVIVGMGFPVDDRCGTHVHLDMRKRDIKRVYRNFFFTQGFLRRLITKSRKRNSYCKMNHNEHYTAEERDRYLGINTQAYNKYGTIEIRMHHGTLDIKELGPWIKLLLRVVNYQGELNKKVLTLKQAKQQYEFDDKLTDELKDRLNFFYKKSTVEPGVIEAATMPTMWNGVLSWGNNV
jgi:hypothetical protein